MSIKKKIIFSFLTIFILSIIAVLVWIISPYPSCGDKSGQLISYHSEKFRISFVYPSSFCIFEDDEGHPIELSRNKLPSFFYSKEDYLNETLKETLRTDLGFQTEVSLRGRINIWPMDFTDKKRLPSKFFALIMKDRFIVSRNENGIEYVLEVFPQRGQSTATLWDALTRATMFSDRLKKAVFISQGSGITDEEFNTVIQSFKFDENN